MKLPIAVKVSATPCMSVVCLLYVSEETYMTLLGSGCEHPRPQKKEADPEGPTSPTDTAHPSIVGCIHLVPRPTSFQKL